ncbi:glycogen debranching enzyme, partial [Candidatus Omnitrophota bacterium]
MTEKYTLMQKTARKLSAGEVNPLGAVCKKDGVNFAVYSEYAKEVFLLLFESPEGRPSDIIKLNRGVGSSWSVFVHGL